MIKDIKLILACFLSVIFIYICYDLSCSYKFLHNSLYKNSEIYQRFCDDIKIAHLLNEIDETPCVNKKLTLITSHLSYIQNNSPDSLDRVEKRLIEIANQYTPPLSHNIKENSVLHIASEIYASGGHSRVIERWIENSPENELHSFLLTRKGEITPRLANSVHKKHGQLLKLDYEKPIIEQALELRKLASEYEKIVLHIHTDDFLPLLAFGHKDFKRPVFLFNHADHLVSVGLSITDCVVNYRKYGADLLKKRQKNTPNKIIPLPIDFDKKNYFNKEESRQELGFPLDKKIIFSSGNERKFIPTKELDYAEFMEKVYSQYNNVLFILVGPQQDFSPHLQNIPQENYKIFNTMDNHKYMKYLATADIVIDSFPVNGGTTVIDSIIAQKPVLSLKTEASQNDFIIESSAYKNSVNELVTACVELLKEESKRAALLEELTAKLNERHSLDAWRKGIKELYETYTTHSIHDFTSVKQKY